jgi:ribosomal protein S3AE
MIDVAVSDGGSAKVTAMGQAHKQAQTSQQTDETDQDQGLFLF